MTSILTNNSAMTALKVLRQTEAGLSTTQERISTGLKVNSAKDDASTWAISQGIKSDVAAFKTMGEGLTMANGAINVAAKAASSINDQITIIKQKIAAAKAPGSDKNSIQADIDSALSQIASITSNASFNGTNLVDNNNALKVLASTSRDSSGAATANYIDVQGVNLNIANGGGLSSLDGLKVTRDALVTGSSSPQSKLTLAGPSTGAGALTLNYKTADGQAKSVVLNVASGATNTSVAQNLIDTFGDALKADGLEVTTDGAGALTVNATKAGAQLLSTASSAAGLTATQTNQAELTFTAASLSVGDEFKVSVNAGGAVKTVVLRVQSDANGLLGKDSDGNDVVGLQLSGLGTAAGIATNVAAGLNLVTATFDAAAATDGTKFKVTSPTAGKLLIESADNSDFITDIQLPEADFADLLDRVESASKVAVGAAQAFGTAQKQAESQQDFLKSLVDSLETGVGALIDADITAESARLNALQTQQQLATQSLSIANQANQLVLSLFR
jgi:flagellin